YDQAAGEAVVPEFSMHALGVNVNGSVNASNLDDTPQVKGKIDVGEFSPGQLLVKLGQELPETSDGEVLDKASLSTAFAATPDSAAIENLRIVLDDSTITGSATVTGFEKPAVRFDIALDAIDADRYLPP